MPGGHQIAAGAPELEGLNIVRVDDTYIARESLRIKKQFNEIFQLPTRALPHLRRARRLAGRII